ncbi:MAG: hypothetical protein MPJ25_01675 [Pirellulales bacterium]|nr:hypothetical protein [Pirellulales bacterium]
MANHVYQSIEILPLETSGKRAPIKRSILKYAEKNNLPFIIHTDRSDLRKEDKHKYNITKITSYAEYRRDFVLEGIHFHDDEVKLYPFLNDAMIICSGNVEYHPENIWFKIVKDGKLVYESPRSATELYYTSEDYVPFKYKKEHDWNKDDRKEVKLPWDN